MFRLAIWNRLKLPLFDLGLAEILIELGKATSEQIETALRRQKEQSPHLRLGEILVQAGTFLTSLGPGVLGALYAGRWPDTVPLEMQRFVDTCLFAAPRMRPQDAWDLHEEFDELLVRLFGPPKYHRLVMA